MIVQKVVRIWYGPWKIRGLFGHTAAGAWVYYGASNLFYRQENAPYVTEEIPRAPAEAPKRPHFAWICLENMITIVLQGHFGVRTHQRLRMKWCSSLIQRIVGVGEEQAPTSGGLLPIRETVLGDRLKDTKWRALPSTLRLSCLLKTIPDDPIEYPGWSFSLKSTILGSRLRTTPLFECVDKTDALDVQILIGPGTGELYLALDVKLFPVLVLAVSGGANWKRAQTIGFEVPMAKEQGAL